MASVSGLVDIQRAPHRVSASRFAYATGDNLYNRRLPGYCENRAFPAPARALARPRAAPACAAADSGCWCGTPIGRRAPPRALVRWAEQSGNGDLVGTYIARRSRRNAGSAVDLTLVRADSGRPLRMGTGHGKQPLRHARTRRTRDRPRPAQPPDPRADAMQRFGFNPYWREWQHFEHSHRRGRLSGRADRLLAAQLLLQVGGKVL